VGQVKNVYLNLKAWDLWTPRATAHNRNKL
jgi:hypothetical protein